MKIHVCEVCEAPQSLVLFPDYSSSGLWCLNCGVGYGDLELELPDLPEGLVSLIDGWISLWDMASCASKKDIYKEYFEKLIKEMGLELNKQINQYYSCIFDIERSKLDDPPRFNKKTGHWEDNNE